MFLKLDKRIFCLLKRCLSIIRLAYLLKRFVDYLPELSIRTFYCLSCFNDNTILLIKNSEVFRFALF